MQISVPGVSVVDIPGPGEPSMIGPGYMVYAALSGGSRATPVDTVVTINGVALIHFPGLAFPYSTLDPNGPQPALGSDSFLHVVTSSVSAKASHKLDLACPARVVQTSVPAPGLSLAGAATLDMAWSPFPVSSGAGVPQLRLRSYDLVTGTSGSFLSSAPLDWSSTSASLAVLPSASTGYVSELSYFGVYLLDGNSGGVCGRVLCYAYTE